MVGEIIECYKSNKKVRLIDSDCLECWSCQKSCFKVKKLKLRSANLNLSNIINSRKCSITMRIFCNFYSLDVVVPFRGCSLMTSITNIGEESKLCENPSNFYHFVSKFGNKGENIRTVKIFADIVSKRHLWVNH